MCVCDYYLNTLRSKPSTIQLLQSAPIEHTDPNQWGIDELDNIPIHLDFLDHKVQIGAYLESNLRNSLIEFLKQHHNYLPWSNKDITSINPEITVHKLQVDPNHPPSNKSDASLLPSATRSSMKRFRSYSTLYQFMRYTTPTNQQMFSQYVRKIGNGEYASTLLISTRPAPRTLSHIHTLT